MNQNVFEKIKKNINNPKVEEPQEDIISVPIEVQVATEVKPHFCKVACGDDYTLALDQNGHVWSCGRNECCQLGRQTSDEYDFTMTPVTCLSDISIVEIFAGAAHSVVLDVKGNVWGFGSNICNHSYVGFYHLMFSYPLILRLNCHALNYNSVRFLR